MNQGKLAALIALSITFVAGLIAIPAIQKVQALDSVSHMIKPVSEERERCIFRGNPAGSNMTAGSNITAGSNMTTPAGNMTGGTSTVNPAALQLEKDNLIHVVVA